MVEKKQINISIITPSFNQGCFIERTIQSVLTQHIPQLEYFIMDGGSTDETVDVLKKYSDQLSWVSEKDAGQADAVNKGFKKASGDIIGWLNSDDVYYPNAIQAVCDFFEKHPEIDIVYGQAYHIDQDDKIIELYPTRSWNLKKLKLSCYLCQPAVFFRRNIFLKYGMLNQQLNYCMDYEYWLRLALAGARFAYLPTVLAGSRLYATTKTVGSPLKCQLEAMQMLKQTIGFVPAEWLITYGIVQVKNTTALRFPQIRFIAAVIISACRAALQWHGKIRGMLVCIALPFVAIKMVVSKLYLT